MLYLDFEAQGRDTTFIMDHALLKKAILLHKRAAIRWLMSISQYAEWDLNKISKTIAETLIALFLIP